jgi:hypothetical protein
MEATEQMLSRRAALKPKAIASMHGSTYVGDGEGRAICLGPGYEGGAGGTCLSAECFPFSTQAE